MEHEYMMRYLHQEVKICQKELGQNISKPEEHQTSLHRVRRDEKNMIVHTYHTEAGADVV